MAIFFIKYTHLNLNFVQENVIKSQNWSNFWPFGWHPICQGPKYNNWHFFQNTDPLLILILCKLKLIDFQISLFYADWQTPHFSKWPTKLGLKYTSWQFFYKMDPLLIWILCRKLFQDFKIGQFWADWQTTTHMS